MDAPWVRSPPNSNLEFIGADYSTVASDLDWTLDEDGMYLAPGVMRFKKGWTLFKDIMESAFSLQYSASCFNCVGPRAITIHAKANRRQLELNGFTIVPNRVLYPRGWQTSHELVVSLPGQTAVQELAKIIQGSWSIHLFGKMTNHLRIEADSIVGEAFTAFSLKIPRRPGYLSTADRELGAPAGLGAGLELRLPSSYQYRSRLAATLAEVPDVDTVGSLNGRFEGLDIILVRAAQRPRVDLARITVSTRRGAGRLTWSSSSARLTGASTEVEGQLGTAREMVLELEKATLKDVNTVLGSLVYVLSPEQTMNDRISIKVIYGEEVVEGEFVVNI